MLKTVAEVVKMGKGVDMVDLRFTDLLGMWHHLTLPARELSEALFEDGIGFDGSSIRAFKEIHESDMILFPDRSSTLWWGDARRRVACRVGRVGLRHVGSGRRRWRGEVAARSFATKGVLCRLVGRGRRAG